MFDIGDEEKLVIKDPIDIDNIDNIDKEPQSKKTGNGINLELGDIVEIVAPTNAEIHENTFFIKYIDDQKIRIINVASFQEIQLNIDEDQRITDHSIRQITILNRSKEPGYARQNGLTVGIWIDVHFGGQIPAIITGEITNLDEDQIEITVFPNLETIYIDFEYKGLPEHIPLTKFVIRKKPSELGKREIQDIKTHLEQGDTSTSLEPEVEYKTTGEAIIRLPEDAEPDNNIHHVLEDLYQRSMKSTIVYGKYLDVITQQVEIPESQKRYGIETQLNSLMDELLSTIPNSDRTKTVLGEIRILIERYKQLREFFSKYDENGNIRGLKILSANYKPAIEHILELDTKLRWFMPVASIKKKIYTEYTYPTILQSDVSEYNDANELEREEQTKKDAYYENKQRVNHVKYASLYQETNPYTMPFEQPPANDIYVTKQRVHADIEAIIDNLEDFYSTSIHQNRAIRSKYVIQKYQLGLSHLVPEIVNGKNVYMTEEMTPADEITIKSFVMMPSPVMEYSRIDLPATSIMEKANLHFSNLSLFRLLKGDMLSHTINDLTKEIDYEEIEKESDQHFLSVTKEYILEQGIAIGDKDRFEKYLQVVIPKTRAMIRLVRKYVKNNFSYIGVVRYLEPFLTYATDISYKQYLEIRFFIKEKIKEIRKKYAEKSKQYLALRNAKYPPPTKNKHITTHLLSEKKEIMDLCIKSYRINESNASLENLQAIWKMDQGQLYTLLLSSVMSSLIIPGNLMPLDQNDEDGSMDNSERILARDCSRRTIAKRYHSIGQLQKDNNHADVFFDSEFDDTPYQIMEKYKDQRKKILAEDFPEFLKENLVQKHDCPADYAEEMASTLIAGKRQVRDGEYAILEIRPKLAKGIDEDTLSPSEKESLATEMDANVKYQYYHRRKENWIHDRDIGEEAFVDNNDLFCNMKPGCMKGPVKCDTNISAKERMKRITTKNAVKEFERRFEVSTEEIQSSLEKKIEFHIRKVGRLAVLHDIQSNRINYLANALGEQAQQNDEIRSPYLALRDMIMGQTDFTKRQLDLLQFCEQFTREPLSDIDEDPYWKYCKKTNTKLVPSFFAELAEEFLTGGNYPHKLDVICAERGQLSEDGDAIVDKYSGYVIRKIDFAMEDGFTVEGFRITSHAIMEKDLGTVVMENLGKKETKVFENEISELIYAIFSFLSTSIGIPTDAIQDFVCRFSLEMATKHVLAEPVYEKYKAKKEKEKGIKQPSYMTYRNEIIIITVASTLLVAIQTCTPSFQTKKTYPGCVRSFSGYPVGGGVEDQTGIKYIACVLEKSKSKIAPWNAIYTLKSTSIIDRIRRTIESIILPNPEIEERIYAKQEYLTLHPEEMIPDEHSIEKWLHFMPPLIDTNVLDKLKGLSADFMSDFMDAMKKGDKNQIKDFYVIKSKQHAYGYAVLESIHKIIQKKEVFLKTASNEPFLENACCNDKMVEPMLYFIQEDERIISHIKQIQSWSEFMKQVSTISKAPFFSHIGNTTLVRPTIPSAIIEENIYEAVVHYLRLDYGLPITADFHGILTEIPDGYKSTWNILEKMEFLKRHGKRYNEESLHQLMQIVQKKNVVSIADKARYSPVDAVKDILQAMEVTKSTVIEADFRSVLSAVLEKHNPKVMRAQRPIDDSTEDEDVLLDGLKNYLSKSISRMHRYIFKFLDQNGIGSIRDREKIHDFMQDIMEWSSDSGKSDSGKSDSGKSDSEKSKKSEKSEKSEKSDSTSSSTQFVKNCLYDITRVIPNMILNETEFLRVPKYWNLSEFDERDLYNFMSAYSAPYNDYKIDPVIKEFMQKIQIKTADLYSLINHIPVYSQFVANDDTTYYSLFDKRAIHLLFTHIFYSVLYEFVIIAEQDDFVKMDVRQSKTDRRKKRKENNDASNTGIEMNFINLDEAFDEYDESLQEVQIEEGNKLALKQKIANLLTTMILSIQINKNHINMSYRTIRERLKKSKDKEKKRITDGFKDLTVEDRQVENMLKKYKLGKWNVGQQRGLVVYDKATSDRERLEMMAQGDKDLEFDLGLQASDDLEVIAEEEGGDEVDGGEDEIEMTDIGKLNANYMDGQYYEEDADQDDFPED